ncbi:hypothetical protein NUSPORA_02279 [Nucleospora cyclopteri]
MCNLQFRILYFKILFFFCLLDSLISGLFNNDFCSNWFFSELSNCSARLFNNKNFLRNLISSESLQILSNNSSFRLFKKAVNSTQSGLSKDKCL